MSEHIALLECGHIRPTSQPNSLSLICPYHNGPQEVVMISNGFSWRCADCRASGKGGAARLETQRKADHHRRRYPGHVTSLLLGERMIETHLPIVQRRLF